MSQLAFDTTSTAVRGSFDILPADLARKVRSRLAGRSVRIRLSRSVRQSMKTPRKMGGSEWSASRRVVSSVDAHPGRWQSEITPHAAHIEDTYAKPWVRTIVFCGVEQAGKTNVMLNCMGRTIDCDPGNIFYLMSTEAAGNKITGEKIIPLIKESPSLARKMTGRHVDIGKELISLKNGVRIFPAHANSATSMATFSAKYCFADELDKYPERAGREASPLVLLKKRHRNHKLFKDFIASSPGNLKDGIHDQLQTCQVIYAWYSCCPHCGDLILMDKDHLIIPAGTDPSDIAAGAIDISYSCNSCGADWGESARAMAYRTGRWKAIKGVDIARPTSVGYHLPAYSLPDISLHEIAASKVRADQGTLGDKIAFANGYEAINYEPPKVAKKAEAILALCDDRPRDLVPTGTAALALQVDTQQVGFYYELAAVAYGDAGTSHLVSKGQLLGFDDLAAFADRTWLDAAGKEFQIHSALIDSGGTRKAGTPPKHSRTKEVYEFCKKNPKFIPVKGTGRKDTPVKYTTLDRWPGTNKAIPGGLVIVTLDVHYFKDELARRLALHPDDPGAFVLYSGYTQGQLEQQSNSGILPANELEDYAKHLCAEYRDVLGIWIHDKKEGRNDYGDCATYRMFHIELLKMQGRLVEPVAVIDSKPKENAAHKSQTRKQKRW